MALQGHPRSLILAQIGSAYSTSYWSSIVTLVRFRDIARFLRRPLDAGEWARAHLQEPYRLPPLLAYGLNFGPLDLASSPRQLSCPLVLWGLDRFKLRKQSLLANMKEIIRVHLRRSLIMN